jgi:hypothetical protein
MTDAKKLASDIVDLMAHIGDFDIILEALGVVAADAINSGYDKPEKQRSKAVFDRAFAARLQSGLPRQAIA